MTKSPTQARHSPVKPEPEFDRQVSGLLQSIYGAVESEGIPDKFLDLLEKLDQAEKTQSTAKDS